MHIYAQTTAARLRVFAYDTIDLMGDRGRPVRVMVATRSAGRAARLIRRAGFRVRRWTPPVAQVPSEEAMIAFSDPGAVKWRSHHVGAGQWMSLPH